MNKRKSLAAILNLVVIISALFLFSACSKKSSAPTEPNVTPAGPVETLYNKATRGGFTINGTDLLASGNANYTINNGAVMEAYTNIISGINEHPVVTSYVENDIYGWSGNYRVETNVWWKGSLAGNGVAGAGDHINITAEIRDFDGNLIATQEIHDKEIKDTYLSVGGIIDDGNKNIVIDFNLPEGTHAFRIRFITKIESWSGLAGLWTQCHFYDYSTTGHGVGWSILKVTELNN